MDLKRFIEISSKNWDSYFSSLQEFENKGLVVLENDRSQKMKVLYPTMLLITETKHHFVAELIGVSNEFKGLKVRGHKERSIDRYFNQFSANEKPAMSFTCRWVNFEGICIAHEESFEKIVKSRFSFIKQFGTTRLVWGNTHDFDSNMSISYDSTFLNFKNVLLVNHCNGSVRVKYISYITVIRKDTTALEYANSFQKLLNFSKGKEFKVGNFVKTDDMALSLLAGQFVSTFLFEGLHETKIGEFLMSHPVIIQRATNTKKLVYEKSFEWQEYRTVKKPKDIKPDFLIQRDDGFFDILELKTALLSKKGLTKRKHNRRSVIDAVDEGLSQLANYEDYFTFSKNADYALEKYGIKVNKPNLILVVGNSENADRTELDEACRKLKENYIIIDYDTLLQLFLSNQAFSK